MHICVYLWNLKTLSLSTTNNYVQANYLRDDFLWGQENSGVIGMVSGTIGQWSEGLTFSRSNVVLIWSLFLEEERRKMERRDICGGVYMCVAGAD